MAQSVPIQQLDELGFLQADKREVNDAFLPEEEQDAIGITIHDSKSDKTYVDVRPPSLITQIHMLSRREFRNLCRDRSALVARFALSIVMSSLVGTIFLHVGASDSSNSSNIQSHFGALVMVLLLSMFGTAMPSLLAFPAERPVFLREYSTNHYSVLSYFTSRLTVEVIITGAQILVIVRRTLHIYIAIRQYSSELTFIQRFTADDDHLLAC